jgi:hypothetical protein
VLDGNNGVDLRHNDKMEEGKMPYMVTKTWYPLTSAKEVGEKFLEAETKFPPDETLSTRVVTAAISNNPNGLEILGVSEVREGKLEESLTRTYNYFREFWEIDGFNYKVEVMANLEEGLAVLGL